MANMGPGRRNRLLRSAFPKRVAPASSFHRPGLGKSPRKRGRVQKAPIDRVKPDDISHFMQRDPMVRESMVCWILVTHRPPDTPHFPDAHEVGLPNIVAAEARFGSLTERSVAAAFRRPSFREVLEVEFMQHHA